MAKPIEHKNADNDWKAQRCIDFGRRDARHAMGMEDSENPNQKIIDASWSSSTKYFFYALGLGHPEAPRCLALAFEEGAGVKEDKYMAALLYGGLL